MKLLGKGGLLEDIKRNLRFSDWNGGPPFQWNETYNILERKTENKLRILGVRLGIALLYFILALLQFFRVFNRASLMVITHSILMLTGMVLMLCNQYANFVQLSGVVQLCNAFIQLEKNFANHLASNKIVQKKESRSKYLFLRGVIYMFTLTAVTGPVVIGLDILRNPCFPAIVGYWINSQCEDDRPGYYLLPTWGLLEIFTNVGISFACYFTWSPMLTGGVFEVSLEYIMEGNCVRGFIDDFGKQLLQIRKDEIRNLKQLTLLYRQLQMIGIHYRLNLSQLLFGCGILCSIALQCACLYNSIFFLSGKDTGAPIWYDLMYAWIEFISFIFVVFVFGMLADINNVSQQLQKNIKGQHDLKRNKWFKRWLKSCPVFKVYFGGSNYFDGLTPLNIQDFAINQTMNMILLQN